MVIENVTIRYSAYDFLSMFYRNYVSHLSDKRDRLTPLLFACF